MNKIVFIAMAVLLSGCQAWVQPEPEPVTQQKEIKNFGLVALNNLKRQGEEYEAKYGKSTASVNFHGSNEIGYVINGKTYYCHFIGQNKYECTE